MNNKPQAKLKNVITYMVITGILLLVLTIGSAEKPAAVNKMDYVSLIENTPSCIDNCYTIYEICGGNYNVQLDANNMRFSFKTGKNDLLRNKEEVNELKDFKIQINDTETLQKWNSNMICNPYNESIYSEINGSWQINTINNCTDYGNYTNYDAETYRTFMPYDKLVHKDECVKIRVTGKINIGSSVDNIMNLKINGIEYDYPEYAWWNASCNYRVQMNKTGSKDSPWTATYFELNSSNINWSHISNESDIYVINSNDQIISYKVMEFNHTSDTAILWINASPYNDTVMTYNTYYNCSGLGDQQNASKIFLLSDDSEGRTSGNMISDGGWSIVSNDNATYTNSFSRYGNMSMYFGYEATGEVFYQHTMSGDVLPAAHTMETWLYVYSQDTSAMFAGMYQMNGAALMSGYQNVNWGNYVGAYTFSTTGATVGWHKIRTDCLNTSLGYHYVDGVKLVIVDTIDCAGTGNIGLRTYSNELSYFDNTLIYPYINFTVETNAFGAEESSVPADSCTLSTTADSNVSCVDACNFTLTNVLKNNVVMSGVGTVYNLDNIKNATRIRVSGGCRARWGST